MQIQQKQKREQNNMQQNRLLRNEIKFPATKYLSLNKKSSTVHKIPYLPYLGFNYDELIFNRLNSQSKQPIKSIFFIRGHFSKGKPKDEDTSEESGLGRPHLTISVNLDNKKDNQNAPKMAKTKKPQESVPQPSPTLQSRRPKKAHPLGSPWRELHLNSLASNYTRYGSVAPADEIIGNKTILNFRTTQHQGHKRSISVHTNKGKVKFGTFGNFFGNEKIAPWGYFQALERGQDNI